DDLHDLPLGAGEFFAFGGRHSRSCAGEWGMSDNPTVGGSATFVNDWRWEHLRAGPARPGGRRAGLGTGRAMPLGPGARKSAGISALRAGHAVWNRGMDEPCPSFHVTTAAAAGWAAYYMFFSPPIGLWTMLVFLGSGFMLLIVAAMEAWIV